MILADKIINERKKLGWSQEELADKLDVSRQSVSKWESAQSTPDLNRILAMADLFGVTTDYLLKDEIEDTNPVIIVEDSVSTRENVRSVSLGQATDFLDTVEKGAPILSFGVSMCIASPVVLLILAGLADKGIVNEALAAAIGVVTILCMVAASVFLFIIYGKKLDEYKFLEESAIDTAYGVDGMVREKKNRYEGHHTMFIAIGVILCIIAAIPLIVAAFLAESVGEYILPIMVAVLLLIISVGVNMIVRVSAVMGSYNQLLQEGDYTPAGKKLSKITGKIGAIYWPLVTGIYLAWSFWTRQWNITWLIWPISAVLFGAIQGCVRVFIKD